MPNISSISPTSGTGNTLIGLSGGPSNGTVITVNGSFSPTLADNTVSVGGVVQSDNLTINTAGTQITFKLNSSALTGPVAVRTTDVNGTWNAITSAVLHVSQGSPAVATPYIGGVSPAWGPTGCTVTVSGEGFGATQGSNSAGFGAPCTILSWSDSTITFVNNGSNKWGNPVGGNYNACNVQVNYSGGGSGNAVFPTVAIPQTGTTANPQTDYLSQATAFFATACIPSIASISPTSGPVGTIVSVVPGTQPGFPDNPENVHVVINGVDQDVLGLDGSGHLLFIATQTGSVQITTKGRPGGLPGGSGLTTYGATGGPAFTITATPTDHSILGSGTVQWTGPITVGESITGANVETMGIGPVKLATGQVGTVQYTNYLYTSAYGFALGNPQVVETLVKISNGIQFRTGTSDDAVPAVGASPVASGSKSGTYSISIDVDHVFSVVPDAGSSPPTFSLVMSMRAKPGGTASASMTLGGVTKAISCTIPYTTGTLTSTLTTGSLAAWQMNTTAVLTAVGYNGPLSIGCHGAGFGGSYDVATAGLATSGSSGSASWSLDFDSGLNCTIANCFIQMSASKDFDRKSWVRGQLRAGDQPYPDAPVPLHVSLENTPPGNAVSTAGDGTFNKQYTEGVSSYSWSVDNSGGVPYASGASPASPGILPVTVSVDGTFLKSKQDAATTANIPMLLQGKQFSAFTVSLPKTLVVEPCTSLGSGTVGWFGAGVSLVAAGIQNNCGTSPTWYRNWASRLPSDTTYARTGAFQCGAYRKMTFRVKSTTHSNVTVKVSLIRTAATNPSFNVGYTYSRSWNIQTGAAGSFVDQEIDLCCPQSWSNGGTSGQAAGASEVDTSDSIYPAPFIEGHLWGVEGITHIQFDTTGVTDTIVVAAISQPWDSHVNLTFLQDSQLTEYASPSSGTQFARYVLGNVDGKQALELAWSDYIHTSGLYAARSLSTMVSDFVAAGWQCSALGPTVGDGYNNMGLPSRAAWGGGAYIDLMTDNWVQGVNVPLSDGSGNPLTLTVPAQALFSSIQFLPGMPNYLGGATTDHMRISFTYAVRGVAHGIGLTDTGQSLSTESGVQVKVSESITGNDGGGGSFDSLGYYQTGSPFGHGYPAPGQSQPTGDMEQVSLVNGASSVLTANPLFFDRKYRRVSFRYLYVAPVVPGANPHNLQTKTVSYCRVHTAGGAIQIHRSRYWKPPHVLVQPITSPPAGATDAEPRLAVCYHDYSFRTLFTRTQSGSSNVYETFSTDGGQSWSSPSLVFAGGVHPFFQMGVSGTIIRGAVVSGTIQAAVQRRFATSSQAPFTFQSGGVNLAVANDTLQVEQLPIAPYSWIAHLTHAGESSTSCWSSPANDMQNWTRLSLPGISGGSHPTVAIGVAGMVAQGAVVGNTIQAFRQRDGNQSALSQFTFNLASGGPLQVNNDTFNVQQAPWGPYSWLLTATQYSTYPYGTGMVADWISDDNCETWTPV